MAKSKHKRIESIKRKSRQKSTAATSVPIRTMATRSMTRKSVSDAVLFTTELLEHILFFLPPKRLLVVQRVSQKWRNVIRSNQDMQELLFFRRAEPTIAWRMAQTELHTPDASGYVGDLHRLRKLDHIPDLGSFQVGEVALSARPNEMIFRRRYLYRRGIDDPDDGVCMDFIAGSRLTKNLGGSWRSMYITQPPATVLEGTFTAWKEWERVTRDFHLVRPSGITVGDLVEHGLELVGEAGSVNWKWCWCDVFELVFTTAEEEKMKSIPEQPPEVDSSTEENDELNAEADESEEGTA